MVSRIILSLWLLTAGMLVTIGGCNSENSDNVRAFDAAVGKARGLADAGREREARATLREAAQMPTERGMRRGDAVLRLGDLYFDAAEFDSARMMFEYAGEEYRGQADRRSSYNATLAQAAMLRQLGAHREAFDMCTEALRLARVFGDRQEELTIQQALLPIAVSLELRDEEELLSSRLLKIARDSALTTLETGVLMETGSGKLLREEYDASVQDYLRAVSVAEQAGDSLGAATALLGLARAFDASGRSKEAIDTYGTAVRRLNSMSGALPTRLETLIRIGNHYLRNGKPIEGERFYTSALNLATTLGNRVAEGYVLIQLGQCRPPREYENAAQRYQQALQLFRTVPFARGTAYAYHALARSSESFGRLTDAAEYYRKSIAESDGLHIPDNQLDVYEECEQLLAGGKSQSVYDNLISLLLQVGKEEEAFWYLERKNTRAINRYLGAMELQTADPNLNRILAELIHTKAICIGAERQLQRVLETKPHHTGLIATVSESMQKAHRDYAIQGDRLAAAGPQLTPVVQFDGLSTAEVQQRLGPEEALVAYALTPRSTYAFVITRTRTGVYLGVSGRDRILGIAQEYFNEIRYHIARVDSGELDRRTPSIRLQELSRFLYETLLLPIEPAIRGVSQLRVILPSGLTSLPLHAVQRKGVQFLAERMLVSYLPAARWLSVPPPRHSPVTSILGCGHAGKTSWDVEYELRDIRAFYKDAQLIFNKQATVSAVQKTHADVMHLALEVEMSERAPGTPYLLFSDGQSATSTSRTSAGMLASFSRAGTVILSNLSPSTRQLQPALPALLLANGTPVVITNGIPAARKAKKVFGEMYYTGLASGLLSPAAFRKAQLEMIKERMYAQPQYWAPFMMWGR